MRPWIRPAIVLLAALSLILAGCGDDDDDDADTATDDSTTDNSFDDGGVYSEPGQNEGGESSETTRDEAFDSDQIIEDFEYVLQPVQAGTDISFVNLDEAPHTLTAEDGSFDSGTVEGGESTTFVAPESGEYDVYCTIHPDITGTLVVEE